MDSAVRLPANGRPDRVGDAHDEGATALAVPEGVQSVGCLAGLRDEEANVVPANSQIMRIGELNFGDPFCQESDVKSYLVENVN